MRLDDSQAGIKISRRSNKKLRYIDDTTLKAENEEELKSLLIMVKRREKKAGLKLNIQKLRSWYRFHHFMAKRWRINGNSDRF